jgi:hypothetical protein
VISGLFLQTGFIEQYDCYLSISPPKQNIAFGREIGYKDGLWMAGNGLTFGRMLHRFSKNNAIFFRQSGLGDLCPEIVGGNSFGFFKSGEECIA